MRIWQFMWQGFWQGIGFEISFLMIFLVWLLLYQNHGHRFDTEHWLHKIHEYLTK